MLVAVVSRAFNPGTKFEKLSDTMRKDILDYVEREALPDGSRYFVDVIGIDWVFKLIDYCGGRWIRIDNV